MAANLKRMQEAGTEVEQAMLAFLMQFDPAGALTVADVKCIANHARSVSFNAFAKATDQ